MKILTVTLIAGIMLEQSGVSVAATSENSAARDDVPRQNPSRLEVLVLPGSCPKGNGICELFSNGRMPRNSYKPRLVMQRRQASSTFWLACAGVIVPRIKKSSIPWRVPTMMLKWRADA